MANAALRKLIEQSLKKKVKPDKILQSFAKLGYDSSEIEGILHTFTERQIETVERKTKTIDKSHIHKGVILHLAGAGKAFGNQIILQDLNFDIHRGEIFGLIGLSGSGKTTILHAMIGFLPVDKGEILVKLRNDAEFCSVLKARSDIEYFFGFSSQDTSLYGKLTAFENLAHFASLYGIEKKDAEARALELLEDMGLSASKDVLAENLSGGMQKRLDIACSLVHKPQVLLLDEPTANLDPFLRRELWRLIENINKQGTTIILASHFLDEIEYLCDRIGVIHNHTLVKVGEPSKLVGDIKHNDVIQLETAPGHYGVLEKKLKKIGKVYAEKHKLLIETSNVEKTLKGLPSALAKQKEKILSISIKRPSLNDVFESVVKGK